MKTSLTISLILLASFSYAQCPSDVCQDAIEVPNQTPEAFCNYDCEEDFNQPWDGWWHSLFPCQYYNYDQWYIIEVQVGGMIQFHIESDYNTIEEIGVDGEYEGVVMDIWEGDDCSSIEFLWGTQCYWMTDEVYYINPPEFNPSRQEWNFTIDLDPGTYFINVDGFGYSVGCGEWWWSEQILLGQTIAEYYGAEKVQYIRKYTGQNYNVLGQRVRQLLE